MLRKTLAEFIGTFVLVFGGAGTAVFAAGVAGVGVGFLGVAIAFGLTVLTMAYAFARVSGAHFNPAVSLGLWAAGRFEGREALPYIVAQVLGGIAGGALIYLIVSDQPDSIASPAERLAGASNGFAAHSPEGYGLVAAILAETVLTLVFLLVIVGSTDRRVPAGFAPIAIGLSLTLIHLISIPITNTSVNPARSIGTAVFAGGWALEQLWVFLVFPVLGAVIGGALYRALYEAD
jgi:aquaporin Z